MPDAQISFDAGSLDAKLAKLVAALDQHDDQNLQGGLRAAAAIYLGFTRRRFQTLTKGGGEWPDLAFSTKLARARKTLAGRTRLARKVKLAGDVERRRWGRNVSSRNDLLRGVIAAMHFDILKDTGLLFNSLSQAPGTPQGPSLQVGTAVRYAAYHQTGGPKLPQRRIFVDPDAPTAAAMGNAYARALARFLATV